MTKTHIFEIPANANIYLRDTQDSLDPLYTYLGEFVRVGYYNGGLGVYTKVYTPELKAINKFVSINTCYLMVE